MKTCSKCGYKKPLSDFSKKKRNSDGLQWHCKSCCKENYDNWLLKNPKNKESVQKRATIWNRENKEQRKLIVQKNGYKKRYGLSLAQKQAMVDDQNGLCYLCGNKMATTHDTCVDHCHSSGKVRKILCRKCNLGLGAFCDNIQTLKNAVEYLKRHS